MDQKELIEKFSKEAKLKSTYQAGKILKALVKVITDELKRGDQVKISGLGIFKVRETKARTARNPKTGETIQVPASKKVSFKVSSTLKREIKG